MPTYDYECDNGHHFELFQSMKDEALTHCNQDQCTAKARRIIGPGAGFIFKGGGFYITDYRSKDYQQKAKSESGAESPGGGAAGGKDSGGGATGGKDASGGATGGKDAGGGGAGGSGGSGTAGGSGSASGADKGGSTGGKSGG